MSPTPMSPVDYQPVMGNAPSPQPSAPPPAAERRRLDPKRSSRDRMQIMGLVVGGCLLVWLAIVLLYPPVTGLTIQPTLPLVIGLIGALIWTGFTVMQNIDEPFCIRLVTVGVLIFGIWGVGTALLMLLNVTPLLSGWVTIIIVGAILQGMPIWVIVLEPGEVVYYRPVYNRPYKYELRSCPVKRIDLVSEPTAQGRGMVASVVRLMNSPASTHEAAQVELTLDFLWVRPVDELRLLWHMEKSIIAEGEIRDIVTNDQSTFTLWAKIAAKLEPTKIRAEDFLVSIPKIESPAKLEGMIKGIIFSNVDKAAREYFIRRTSYDARGEAGVIGFRSELTERLRGLGDVFGLTFVQSVINTTPIVSDEQRTASNRAAAAAAHARAELSTTDAIVERAMGGSTQDRLWLYTRLIEKGAQFHVLPQSEQMPQISEVDRFLWRVTRGDQQAIDLLRTLVASHPETPVPPALLPYLTDSGQAAGSQPAFYTPPAFQTPPIQISDTPPSEPPPTGTSDLPLPAPARLRTNETVPPNEEPRRTFPTPPDTMPPDVPADAPPMPPPNLPEAPTQTPDKPTRPPAGGLRPNIDIYGALNTRQRPDGSYEVDLDNDDEDS